MVSHSKIVCITSGNCQRKSSLRETMEKNKADGVKTGRTESAVRNKACCKI